MDMKTKRWQGIIPYVIILVVVVLIKMFIVTPVKVNGQSMEPTLYSNDIMLLDKISYKTGKINRFDIVVVYDHNTHIIKRVIGLPGDNIEYQNNQLYVNGKKVEEGFKHKKTADFSLDLLDASTVPDDYYFVLGDNRENSLDSRVIGFVNKKQILGKADFVIFPFNRFGKK